MIWVLFFLIYVLQLHNLFSQVLCFWIILVLIVLRVMGASALQKYISSLGGIGASGVGSSSSYSTKELNKEVLPEKVLSFLNSDLFGFFIPFYHWLD